MAAQAQEYPRPRTDTTGHEPVPAEDQRSQLARHVDRGTLGDHDPECGEEHQERAVERWWRPFIPRLPRTG